MKLRYTSLQADVGAAEEQAPSMDWPDLDGRPVVACGLHSQVGIVAAVVKDLEPGARVAYVMTDGAALPLALSDLVAGLRERALLDVTITAGQAFGGELEAVSVPSALDLAVRLAGADMVIVAMGPGVVGTGSALGTTALEVAPIVDAAGALGGQPIVAARTSEADPRPRHQGLSHHTTAALRLAARAAIVGHAVGPAGVRGTAAAPRPHGRGARGGRRPGPGGDRRAVDGPGTGGRPAVLRHHRGGRGARSPISPVAGYGELVISQEPGPGEPGSAGTDDPAAPTGPVADDGTVPPRPATPPKRVGRAVREWILVIGGALVVALLIRTFLFQAYEIPSPSMVNTLNVGDRVLVNKLAYKFHDIHRGDVVVFKRPPGEPDPKIKDLIKRVIGLPGETLVFKDCSVFIGGKRLDEPYVDQQCTDPPQNAVDPDGDG